MHFGLLAANQSQRDPSSGDPIEVALAKGKGLRKAGNFTAALNEFNRALTFSRQAKNVQQTVRSLILISTVQLLTFQYQKAMAAAKEAADMAREAGYYRLAGGACGTMSSIYLLLGDPRTAEAEGKRAIELLKRAPPNESGTREFLVKAYHQQASLCYFQGRIGEGEGYFQQAAALVQQLGDKLLEANSWDNRGIALLRNNQFPLAEESLMKAFALRREANDADTLPVSKEHLAELELNRPKPDFAAALKLIDEAFASNSTTFKTGSQYYPIHIRGRILLGCGKRLAALKDFRRAVQSADVWRQGALPGDATNTQTVQELHDVYLDFAHLAAQISLETNESTLGEEALQVLAANRAASLREQLRLALATDARLPDSYFQKLSALQAAQARVTLGKNSRADQAELNRVRTELNEFENQIAIQIGKNYFSDEKILRRNSLRDIRTRLGNQQLLLSFSLGDTKSYLWAVSGDQVNLYQIDGRANLETKAAQFKKSANEGKDLKDTGKTLSCALFGSLPPAASKKPAWLIVADGALLNGVPFAALPTCSDKAAPSILEEHTLRILPSELLLLATRNYTAPVNRFVGVADPIYNKADSRLQRKASVQPEASSLTLARLAGSSQEIRSSAQSSGLPEQVVLDGPRASTENLRKVLATPPQFLHFAVHVVSPPDRLQEAALALSLKEGVPELLTPEAIATFRLPGSLIVLSGCSSGQGKAAPSAGLLGLSRAWLLAGATAVIASAWPTPDDSGRFFSTFYSRLRALKPGPLSQRAALALAQTQLEMQRSSGYTSSPSYWAAYSIVSKE